MIVDCHTHIWQSPDQLGQLELGEVSRSARRRPSMPRMTIPSADADHHWAQSGTVDRSIVLGFKSRYLKAEVPNRYISEYVTRFPAKLIGFAGIDPTERGAVAEVRAARTDLHLRGITLSPANQDFHPSDSRAMHVYAAAEELGMPVLIHPAGRFTEQSKLEYGRPYLFDEVARTFPSLRLIIAQMGQPWVEETICMLGKHANVFTDVSGMLCRPWQAYNALISAHQYQVMDKILFGSNFPYNNAEQCIESLYSTNQFAQGTNLPMVPREALRRIVERESLPLLGLE
jgi:predicted TIM-barrel fold metal-dependent hydrolase